MHESVAKAWHAFSTPFEGRVASMYLDVRALVTCAVGVLIDASLSGSSAPWAPAWLLPWKHADGTAATREEIRAAWQNLKAHPELAKKHWRFAAALNDLRLSDDDIDALVQQMLAKNEAELRKAFPGWDTWPADAQLGALSMAWAVGAGFPRIFKRFTASANAGRWDAAAVECKIREVSGGVPNPGIIPRNKANALCFRNAAIVTDRVLPRDVLHWPNEAS